MQNRLHKHKAEKAALHKTKVKDNGVNWKESANEREAFKDESKRLDEDIGRHGSDANYNKNVSPGDKYREQDGEHVPGSNSVPNGGSNFGPNGGSNRPGGKPGNGSDDCCSQ